MTKKRKKKFSLVLIKFIKNFFNYIFYFFIFKSNGTKIKKKKIIIYYLFIKRRYKFILFQHCFFFHIIIRN